MKRGFTLLEVMIALAIMALALTAIVGINGNAITQHAYSKRVTVATMLARSKLADLESEFYKEGFDSQFDQRVVGDFSEEGWKDFAWEAEIIKPDLDPAAATEMVRVMAQQFTSGLEEDVSRTRDQIQGPTIGLDGLSSTMADQYTGLIESQVGQIVETLEQSVREVRLRVTWQEGKEIESVDVTTHFVILPGQEWVQPI